MKLLKLADFKAEFLDDDACLEWLKNRLYPEGIRCPVCNRVTRHYKVAKRTCYACNNCRHHISITKGTIFYKSGLALKTWFAVIRRISESRGRLSAKDIQREYGMTYKTAWRMVQKIKKLRIKNRFEPSLKSQHSSFDLNHIGTNLMTPQKQRNNGQIDKIQLKNAGRDLNVKENIIDINAKNDRLSRLLKLQMVLCQYPHGLHINEIASKCCVSKRTVYRDLRVLESELKIPIWEEGSLRGITEGYFLPPINFTRPEAVNFLMAVRMMQCVNYQYIPDMASLFLKLNTIMPVPLKKQIRITLDYMEKLPFHERQVNNHSKLVDALFSHHRVRIVAQCANETNPVERVVDPYFLEPSYSLIGGLSYLIAYCNLKKTICAFKLAQIIGDVYIEPDVFEIPDDFNIIDYLDDGWGICSDNNEIMNVILRCDSNISRLIKENRLHSSQSLEMQKDGSSIVTLKVRDTQQFRNLIIGMGNQIEIVEPQKLRNQIFDLAQSLMNIYSDRHRSN